MSHVHLILGLVVVAAGGCDFADMRPGDACGTCHDGKRAPAFGAAGTVYSASTASAHDGLEGVTVDIVDSTGQFVSMESSGSGNFLTTRELRPPLQITISRAGKSATMADAASGDCNSCHTQQSAPKPGPISLP